MMHDASMPHGLPAGAVSVEADQAALALRQAAPRPMRVNPGSGGTGREPVGGIWNRANARKKWVM